MGNAHYWTVDHWHQFWSERWFSSNVLERDLTNFTAWRCWNRLSTDHHNFNFAVSNSWTDQCPWQWYGLALLARIDHHTRNIAGDNFGYLGINLIQNEFQGQLFKLYNGNFIEIFNDYLDQIGKYILTQGGLEKSLTNFRGVSSFLDLGGQVVHNTVHGPSPLPGGAFYSAKIWGVQSVFFCKKEEPSRTPFLWYYFFFIHNTMIRFDTI